MSLLKSNFKSSDESLTYILPKLALDGDDHFPAVIGLLRRITKKINLTVIAERGDNTVNIPGATKTVILPDVHPALRIFFLYAAIHKTWNDGCRIYFVRISKTAALAAGLWCRIFGGELLYWHSGSITYRPLKSFRHFKDWLFSGLPARTAFRLCNRLVTGPDSMREFYVREHGVSAGKIIILPNDVDTGRFRLATRQEKTALRNRLDLPGGRIVLLLHRLSPVRRHTVYFPRILSALEQDDNATLVIVGDGPERAVLAKMISRSSSRNRILMAGAQPHSRVHDYLRAADIFLNPSYVEGFPRVVIEAMACGLPALVTDAGGTAELLPESHKDWIVPRDDVDEFGRKLIQMLDMDADELEEIGSSLAAHAQKYSTEAVAKAYVQGLFGTN